MMKPLTRPRNRILLLSAFSGLLSVLSSLNAAEQFLVRDGQSQAEIVIAERPQRTTRMAARELQTYVQKISGAQLPIVTAPSDADRIRIFVGQSSHTDKLGITVDGLKDGAYRIVSGDRWLVLIGDDTNFTPTEPWPRSNNDIASGKMQQAWNAITGKHWGYTHSQLHKHYSGPNSLFGTPNEKTTDEDGNVHVWTYDERGSFNAVCGFLRDLGVRWYMPGDIGEIVPQQKSIALPQIDKTVRPDFPMRILNFRTAVYGHDAMMWGFRLGVRQPYGRQAAHGLDRMTDNEYTLKHHPNWFALYGGKRHTQSGLRLHQLCYSNEELFREAVEFARVQFDHFDMDVVSIMPPDGYTAICQCELCAGKESPELGYRGKLSNYVWDFVNRVAKDVAKTHPGKKISNCAYGVYTNPPNNIDKLEPNVQVIIVGGRRPTAADREELRQLRKAWAAKTDNPIEIFENYPFTGRGFYLPAFIPTVLGESVNATKGMSRGEDIWLTMDFGDGAIGYNHFLIYFTARMYWGGADQNAVALFDEYCDLFYGPAAKEMRTFFRYCEDHWREMEKDGVKASRALELFAAAKGKAQSAGADSVYSRRIKLIDNYLNGLRNKSVQLAQKRGPVPKLRLVGRSRGKVVIDGKLDDETWQKCPVASTGRMLELQTGRQPVFGTSIKVAWIGNDLYFGIQCDETVAHHSRVPWDGASASVSKPNIATTKDGDQAIWYGDAVEILLATESHSYYQLAVNPAGALVDLDRGADRRNWFNWSSQAEVATHVADDHWNVEIRIPVTADENDPLHQVVGHRPTQSLPWHINVCRQRIRENGSEYSAFSPTGEAGFHKPLKFAHFYSGLSHQFPADSSVTDFVIAENAADRLLRGRKYEEAMAAFVTLAATAKATELQQSHALQQAAMCARSFRHLGRADELAEQIPIEAVQKTVQMENLLAQRKQVQIVEQFGSEDIRAWPFPHIGAAAFARARAYAATKAGEEAEADFRTALEFTSDERIRTNILTQMGNNRERHLQDDEGALAAYRLNFESNASVGAADEFRAIQNAARILTRQKKFDQALDALDRANAEKLNGFWRHSTMLVIADTLTVAGRKDDALKVYRQVANDKSASKSHRANAEANIRKLSPESSENECAATPQAADSNDESATRIDKPNILLILADDLSWSDPGFAGHPWHRTPNIDRLAQSGLVFTNGYAPAPICSASRASILTGKTTARLGFEFVTKNEPGRQKIDLSTALTAPPFTLNLPLKEETIAERLARRGYLTAYFGKWHLNAHYQRYLGWSPTHGPVKQGFQLAVEDFGAHPYSWGKRMPAPITKEGTFAADSMVKRVCEFLEDDHGAPFFAMVSSFYVHTPVRTPCQWLIDRYQKIIPADSPNRSRRIAYAAFLQTFDHHVGQILKSLESSGEQDRTLVVFTSDNGGHPEYTSNAPLRGSKWNLYEGGIRVPLIVRWPGHTTPGDKTDTPAVGYDLLPTFVAAAGGNANDVDGTSLVPFLSDPDSSAKDRSLVWHFPYYHPEKGYAKSLERTGVADFAVSKTRPQSALRQGPYKLVRYYEDNRAELFNLVNDPAEQHDLRTSHQELTATLKARLDQQLTSMNARHAR